MDYIAPFLSKKFVDFALKIPVEFKIKGEGDKIRKRILRRAAIDLGVPMSAALRPKKAFQYSSGLHKAILKLAKKNGFSKRIATSQGFSGEIEAYVKSLGVHSHTVMRPWF